MTIAYLFDTFPNLSETFLAREILALREMGFEIRVFALKAGDGAESIENVSTRMARRFGQKGWYDVGAAWWRQLENSGQSQNIHWIHAAFASHPAEIAMGAARVANLPWSFAGHARDIWVEGGDLKTKIKAAQFAVSCTQSGARHLQSIATDCAEKVFHASHGLPLEEYPFSAWSQSREILAVGRLVPKKGFDVLLRALPLVQSEYSDVRLTIVGDGPQKNYLKQLAHELDIGVNWLGAMPHNEVKKRMQQSGCMVLPSVQTSDGDRDGIPNVLMEAAACGLPIVSTRAGSIEELLGDEHGRLCAPGDVQMLAQNILDVWRAPQQSETLRLAARRQVESQFCLRHNAEQLAELFRRGE